MTASPGKLNGPEQYGVCASATPTVGQFLGMAWPVIFWLIFVPGPDDAEQEPGPGVRTPPRWTEIDVSRHRALRSAPRLADFGVSDERARPAQLRVIDERLRKRFMRSVQIARIQCVESTRASDLGMMSLDESDETSPAVGAS